MVAVLAFGLRFEFPILLLLNNSLFLIDRLEKYFTLSESSSLQILKYVKFVEYPEVTLPAQGGLHSRVMYCNKCSVTFTTQHALLRHIASKHESTPDAAAYCDICQRFFKTKWSRATHNSRYHRT